MCGTYVCLCGLSLVSSPEVQACGDEELYVGTVVTTCPSRSPRGTLRGLWAGVRENSLSAEDGCEENEW